MDNYSYYVELFNEVCKKLTVKKKMGKIYAVKANNVDEYNLALSMWAAGQSSLCHVIVPNMIDGQYEGPDWYIFEKTEIDMGMDGRIEEFSVKSLNKKKEDFKKYCDGFE